MSKYGYLTCDCSDPGKDYIESHEILDIDDNGFTIGVKRGSQYLGYKDSPDLKTAEDGVAEIIKRHKDYYERWQTDFKVPEDEQWFNHTDSQYHAVTVDKDNRVYVDLYTKEKLNVPFMLVKEHSKDNFSRGLFVKASWFSDESDYDKEFRRALGDWVHNVKISDKYEARITRTWSLD